MKTVLLLILITAALIPAPAQAQSLGDAARTEAIRRQGITAPGRVYTNASLPVVAPPPRLPAPETDVASLITPPEPETDALAPPANFDDRDETYWRHRSEAIRRQRSQHRDDVAALFARASAPAGGGAAGQAERTLTLGALAAAQADLAALEAEWTELEKEALIAKVPAFWLR